MMDINGELQTIIDVYSCCNYGCLSMIIDYYSECITQTISRVLFDWLQIFLVIIRCSTYGSDCSNQSKLVFLNKQLKHLNTEVSKTMGHLSKLQLNRSSNYKESHSSRKLWGSRQTSIGAMIGCRCWTTQSTRASWPCHSRPVPTSPWAVIGGAEMGDIESIGTFDMYVICIYIYVICM